ncbi:hypothetical protein HYZ64_04035 [Candidatus Berkelbacteria bacterium]|nr:hypothetical protein [Candidatus Berkelbacteria bacterium]
MEEISQILGQLGLDEKESRVYLSVLRLGQTTVSQVAQAAGVERTGTYDVLERLQKQGLVRQVAIGKIVNFAAEDPKKLLSDLEARRQQLEELIPQLANLYGETLTRPVSAIYEGKEGVRALLSDIFKTQTKEIRLIYSAPLSEIVGEEFIERLQEQRVASGVGIRVLTVAHYNDTYHDSVRSNSEILMTVRQVPESLALPLTTYLIDHKTALISHKKPAYGWLVESPDFAKQQQAFFEAMWLIAKPR